ncbi:hypothetical protein MCOR02_004041 [Pyricularia oryzae]|nr:hypothetical protein MCOR02_004041 [Pyricularia oryzae]
MSNLFSGINARFRGGTNKPAIQTKSPPNLGSGPASPTALSASQSSSSLASKLPPLPNSPSLAQTLGMDENSGIMATGEDILNSYHLPRPLPCGLTPAMHDI